MSETLCCTCFLTLEKFCNGATQFSTVLKLFDQISLKREDVRKKLHQSVLCFLEHTRRTHMYI